MEERRLQFMLANREVGGCNIFTSLSKDYFSYAKDRFNQEILLSQLGSAYITDIYYNGWKDPLTFAASNNYAFYITGIDESGSGISMGYVYELSDTDAGFAIDFLSSLKITNQGIEVAGEFEPSWLNGKVFPYKWWINDSSYEEGGFVHSTSSLLPAKITIDWVNGGQVYVYNKDGVNTFNGYMDYNWANMKNFVLIYSIRDYGFGNMVDSVVIENQLKE